VATPVRLNATHAVPYYLFQNTQRFSFNGSQWVKNNTMSKLFIAFALSLVLFSCSKKDNNPALPAGIQLAIDTYTSCTCDPYIKLYAWRGQAVYLQYIAGPTCNGVPVYYNKDGERITMDTGYTLDQFLAESRFVRTVWQCRAVAER
jgi:hypothetical protein